MHIFTIWQIAASAFNAGWLYLPCMLTVLGFWKTLFATIIAALFFLIAMMAMLIVRRRRAIVLQSWKRGFLSLRGERQATANAITTNNNNNNNNNKFDYTATDEALLCLSDLRAGPALWPSGTTRMFEGSDVYHDDLSLEAAWRFVFGSGGDVAPNATGTDDARENARSRSPSAARSGSVSNSSSADAVNDFLADPVHATTRFVRNNLVAFIDDGLAFTYSVSDGYQGFVCLSLLAMLVCGLPAGGSAASHHQQQHSFAARLSAAELFGPLDLYFPSLWHKAVAAGGALLVWLAARFVEVTRLRMLYVGAIFVLLSVVATRETLSSLAARGVPEPHPLAPLEKTAAATSHHFPTDTALFRALFAAPQTAREERLDEWENDVVIPLRLSKRPLANPTACLLSKSQQKQIHSALKNRTQQQQQQQARGEGNINGGGGGGTETSDYVPLYRQLTVFIVSIFFRFLADEGANVKRHAVPERPVGNPLLQLAGARGEMGDDEKQQNEKQQARILMDDSIAHHHAQYRQVALIRACAAFAFMLLAGQVSQMMSWEVNISAWMSVVLLKMRHHSGASPAPFDLFDYALAVVLALFMVYMALLTLEWAVGRARSHATSLYVRYGWVRHLAVATVVLLLAHRDETMRSGAAMRGAGERDSGGGGGGGAPAPAMNWFSAATATLLLGGNLYAKVSLFHFYIYGVKFLVAPILLVAESASQLERLQIPATMTVQQNSGRLSLLLLEGASGTTLKSAALGLLVAWLSFVYAM